MSIILGSNLFYVKYVSFAVSFVTFPKHRKYYVVYVYKRTVSRDEYFLWPIKLNQDFLYMRWWYLNFFVLIAKIMK
jgi:hypothetical protein